MTNLIRDMFLTGSRIYGQPRDDSDQDLFILLRERDTPQASYMCVYVDIYKDVRLNIVLFYENEEEDKNCFYASWAATRELIASNKQQTRDEAIAVFRKYQNEYGVTDNYFDHRYAISRQSTL